MSKFFEITQTYIFLTDSGFNPMIYSFESIINCVTNFSSSMISSKFLGQYGVSYPVIFTTMDDLSGFSRVSLAETLSKGFVRNYSLYPSSVTLSCDYYADAILIKIYDTKVGTVYTLVLDRVICENLQKCLPDIKNILSGNGDFSGEFTPNSFTILNVLKLIEILKFLWKIRTSIPRNYLP